MCVRVRVSVCSGLETFNSTLEPVEASQPFVAQHGNGESPGLNRYPTWKTYKHGGLPSGKTNITMENHHFQSEKLTINGDFQ